MYQQSAGGPRPSARAPLFLACLAAALATAAVPAPAFAAPPAAYDVGAEIRSEVNRELRSFYKDRGYRPLWIRNGDVGPEADRLLELVSTADLDGLDPADYNPGALRRTIDKARGGSAEALAKAEIRLSRTFADYVRDVGRRPSVEMVYLDEELEPERPAASAVLRAAAVAPSLAGYLDDMGWANPYYAGLRKKLADYGTRGEQLPDFDIPAGPTLRLGSISARVSLLRRRLGLSDDEIFDEQVASAIRDFQAARGLPVDGIVGAVTLAALNGGSADERRTVRLNLERARALPASRTGRYILVDAAAARLWMYEDGEVQDTMRVIVGKPTEPTPMLAGVVRYAVVNPYWNVPPDLVRTSIVPKVVEQGRSLQSMGYEALSDWTHDARILTPEEIDWDAVASGREDLRVRQLPGKANAMGKMKFMFPNDLGIYLHDTPDKSLFDKEERRFSSGCVRVEDAQRLAQWLFGKPLRARSDAPEQRVSLTDPVPVYITYLTAAPTEKGIAFREDFYNRDAAQLARLGNGPAATGF